jgi:hypothetical protein
MTTTTKRTAERYANLLERNVAEMYAKRVTFETFDGINRNVWDEIAAEGMRDAVSAILRERHANRKAQSRGDQP